MTARVTRARALREAAAAMEEAERDESSSEDDGEYVGSSSSGVDESSVSNVADEARLLQQEERAYQLTVQESLKEQVRAPDALGSRSKRTSLIRRWPT